METDLKVALAHRVEKVESILHLSKANSKVQKLIKKCKIDGVENAILLSANTIADVVEPSQNTTVPEVILHYKARKNMMKVVTIECDGIEVTFAPRVFDDTYPVKVLDKFYTHPEAASRLRSFLP